MINLKKFAAEFVGTFFLVFVGTGAIVVNDVISGNLTVVGVSLAFGLAVGLPVYLFSSISGAHINPAVTLGFWLEGRLNRLLMFTYLTAQFTGALLASGILRLAFPSHSTLGATFPAINIGGALFLEAFLTFNLMMVILIFGGKKISSAFAIGGTVAISSYIAGPFTGASMNPARSLGPAFFSGNFDTLWIYLLGPVLGGIFAALAWFFIKPKFLSWQNQER